MPGCDQSNQFKPVRGCPLLARGGTRRLFTAGGVNRWVVTLIAALASGLIALCLCGGLCYLRLRRRRRHLKGIIRPAAALACNRPPPLRLCSSCPPSPAPSPDALVTAPSLGCRDAERDFARWEPPAGPRRGCCAAPPLGTSRDQPGWEEAVGRGRCTAPSPSRSCLAPSGARRLGSWQRHTRCGPAMAETEIISPPYLPHISS